MPKSTVPKLVEQLIGRIVPECEGKEKISHFKLCLRLLEAPLGDDDFSVQQMLTSMEGKLDVESMRRLQDITLTLLKRNGGLERKNEVFQILYFLRGRKNQKNVAIWDEKNESQKNKSLMIQHKDKNQEMSAIRGVSQLNENHQSFYQEYENYRNTAYELSEEVLLRDIIFAFQGINGKFIKYDPFVQGFIVDNKVGCPKSTRDMIRKLCELGWMYKQVKSFVDTTATQPSRGLAIQSFCAGIDKQLMAYYELIARLEEQIHISSKEYQLTLRQLVVWSLDPAERLKSLLILVDACRNAKGGLLATLVHSYTNHGDPYVRAFTKEILKHVCAPIYNTIHKWIFEGELEDPFDEFFVQQSDVPKEDIWEKKYTLRKEMLPSFMDLELAEKILRIGKSINFLKYSCSDHEWRMDTTLSQRNLNFENLETFIEVIQQSAELADRRVLEVLQEKFHFSDHLHAIKRYLLLGQGDFISYLLQVFKHELCKPSNSIDRYTLPTLLDNAIKNSNAQYDKMTEFLKCSLPIQAKTDSVSGWDIFTLEYECLEPTNSILNQPTLQQFLRIFKFLWYIKRVESELNNSWKNQMMLTKRTQQSAFNVYLWPILHPCNMLRHEMQYFIHNLQYFLMFEVIESSWTELLAKTHKIYASGNFDELIKLHREYPEILIRKSFLDAEGIPVHVHLKKLLTIILEFLTKWDEVNNTCSDLLLKADMQLDESLMSDETSTQTQDSTLFESRDTKIRLEKLRGRIRLLKKQYDLLFAHLLSMKKAHPFVKIFPVAM